jgi:hypothetical protein
MRTSAVALAHLHDEAAVLVEAAMGVSALTHADPRAGEACALWCLAIRHAVLTGTFDGVRQGVHELPAGSRDFWRDRLDEASRRTRRRSLRTDLWSPRCRRLVGDRAHARAAPRPGRGVRSAAGRCWTRWRRHPHRQRHRHRRLHRRGAAWRPWGGERVSGRVARHGARLARRASRRPRRPGAAHRQPGPGQHRLAGDRVHRLPPLAGARLVGRPPPTTRRCT